ncbi:hypothetical protein FOA43_002412 [Brettanomyces nanus]|uniref:Ceramide glucosyltransferase n=1 Tax=Eeniella nana TaxID=13502 RepID=A0A875S4T5_EENNA|nr:uncharacterized protein FOA43_002412 [Brettanomyces nanus]QPG75072.1 hypothetical protein FOA43_002412 [Brettanomyces nanus]
MQLCLRSSFEQDYPVDQLEIIFCIQDPHDPAIEIVQYLISQYPKIDAKLMIDDTSGGFPDNYGPNPKINNLSKGYKAAKYDVLWVIDSNAWARPDTLKRSIYSMVHNLHNGRKVNGSKRVKMMNHIPLAVALDDTSMGCYLDEMFLSSSHAKFYVSLNTLAVAPCVNGKSNIYRRSDLDHAVARMGEQASHESVDGLSGNNFSDARYYGSHPGEGIRFFARYIAEDNMIGQALWDYVGGRAGMSTDAVVQPLGGTNTLSDYINRRVRWLRVRKYMVLAATLVEPATECLMSGLIGSFSLSVIFWQCKFNVLYFSLHVLIWFLVDYCQFHLLASYVKALPTDGTSWQFPYFLRTSYHCQGGLMSVAQFIPVWITRELLAFPIWLIAMIGSRIDWRGQPFKIKADLTAERL